MQTADFYRGVYTCIVLFPSTGSFWLIVVKVCTLGNLIMMPVCLNITQVSLYITFSLLLRLALNGGNGTLLDSLSQQSAVCILLSVHILFVHHIAFLIIYLGLIIC